METNKFLYAPGGVARGIYETQDFEFHIMMRMQNGLTVLLRFNLN